MTNNLLRAVRFCRTRAASFVGGLIVLFAALAMTGCDKQQSEFAERGGGFAVLNNGELFSINSDGSLGSSCNLCSVEESRDSCKARADQRGIELCENVFRKVEGSPDSAQEKGAQSSLEVISSARAVQQVKMCHVVLKSSGPASVPVTMHGNGYACWDVAQSFGDVCECVQL